MNKVVLKGNDSFPFGMLVPNRNYSSPEYRYGFQGQEKDDEIKGNGNSINYKFRMHDPRVGRFFAVDPLAFAYVWNSPYAFSENRVIDRVELEGLESMDFKVAMWEAQKAQIKALDAGATHEQSQKVYKKTLNANLPFGNLPDEVSVVGEIGVGFVPVAAQIIDAKDTYTAFESGNGWDKTFALAAWIPGLDFLKSGRKIFKATVKATSKYKYITKGYKIAGKYTKDFLNSADQVIKGLGSKKFKLSNFDNLAGAGNEQFQKALRKMNENVEHFTDSDISGMIKEMHGTSIVSDTGKIFNHTKEVENAIEGLDKSRKILEQGFKNRTFSDDVLESAKSLYKHLEGEIKRLNNIIEGVQKSIKKSN